MRARETTLHTRTSRMLSRRELLRRGAQLGLATAVTGRTLGTGIPAHAAPAVKRGGRLVYAAATDMYSPAPYVYGGSGGMAVNGNVYNSLITFDPTGKIVPEMAQAYRALDPTTYVFTLRRGVKFHAGGELTSADVKFSLDLYMSGKAGATRAAVLSKAIAAVAAPDAATVKITLKEPDATILSVLALRDVPIISQDWVAAGHDYRKEWNGTGPFKMAEAAPGDHYKLVRNDAYFRPGLPYLDALDVPIVGNDTTRVDGVRASEYDIANYFPWQSAAAFESDRTLHLEKGWSTFNCVVLNHARPPFGDQRVRQAVSYSINRDLVNKIAFGGYGIPIPGGLFRKGSLYYCPDNATLYPYDPAKARALLKEAGHPNGITMELVLANFTPYLDPFNVMQQQWKQVGINVKVISTDVGGMGELRVNGKYQALWTGTSLLYPDPDAYSEFFASTGAFYGRATQFKDPQLDALFAREQHELNLKQREAIGCEIEHQAMELATWVFINWRPDFYGMRAQVQGFHALPGVLNLYTPTVLDRTWLNR